MDTTACERVGHLHTSIDVFSFAMIIWELATLVPELKASLGFPEPPYDWKAMALKIQDGERPDIESVVKSCGEDLGNLLKQCWSPSRESRPSSATIKV